MSEPADDTLTDDERDHLLRYPDGMTLHQVARVLGCSHEDVRRVQDRALAKLRIALDAMETER